MLDRTPCINPRCRRTFRREEFPFEVVCGKCFALAPALRARYRRLRRLLKRADRHGWPEERRRRLTVLFEANWSKLKKFYQNPPQPLGLEPFLKEMGMR